jgi:hypothetical protein
MVYGQGLITADAVGGCGFHGQHRMGDDGQSCLHLFKKDR